MIGLGNSVVKRKIFAPSVPAAPVNVVLPSLTGTGLVGSTITCDKGTWTGVPTPTYEYDFKADGVSVQLGISNEYVTAGPDINKVITCEVIATNSQGSASATTSNSITVGTAPVNTVAPTVSPSGTQITGTVITVNVGTWTGTPTITYEYRWTRNGSPITGAVNSTYTIQVADDGTTIRCEVRGTNAYGVSLYVASSNSVSAVNAVAPVNTVAPVISGSTTLGSTLTSTTGTWTGIPTPTYSYQWKRNGSNIGGATNSTYVTTLADSSANITCDVTATNTAGSATAGSNTITLPSYAPVNTVLPVVSGTAVVGQTLSTTNGTWVNSPSTFAYQWFRGATPIGTNSANYTLVQADAGNTSNITCRVTATNSAGSANATSNTIARILDTLTNAYITGLTLTSGEIDSFNTLYLALRSNNYHTQIDRLHVYASATQAAANKSLFGNFTASGINSPTWSRKVGYTHTGTSVVNTNYNLSTNASLFQLDNHTVGNRTDNKNNATTAFTGAAQTASPANALQCAVITSTGVTYASLSAQNSNVFTGRVDQSRFGIRRQNSSGYTAYLDSSTQAVTASRSHSLPNLTWYDGGRNLDGAISLPVESGAISVYSYHGSSTIVPTTLNQIIDDFINSL